MTQAVNFVNGAGGSINPSRFVVQDTTSPKAVNQASAATSFIVGVSAEYSKYAPVSGASTVIADAPGDPLQVYQEGETCWLQSSTLGWTAGDRLTSDANGQGITATSTNFYGAIGLTTLSGAGLGQVKVLCGKNP